MLMVLAGISAVTAFSVRERGKAATSETFVRDTAFGDLTYYDARRTAAEPGVPALIWQDTPLFASRPNKLKIDDGEMQRIGTDPATGLSIYRLRGGTADGLFVKIDIGEFLPLESEPQP
jgi:hypothetical protein